MKDKWNNKRFIALFMAIAMVLISGVVVTFSTFHATDTDEYTTEAPAEEAAPAEEPAATEEAAPAEEPQAEQSNEAAEAEQPAASEEAAPSGEASAPEGEAAGADQAAGQATEQQAGAEQQQAAADQQAEAQPAEAVEEQAEEKTDDKKEDKKEEEKKEEEQAVNMPAVSFAKASGSGVGVTVNASEGIFPEGTTMQVTDVSEKSVLSKVENVVDVNSSTRAVAVDISFRDATGAEIEPANSQKVSVTLTPPETLTGSEFALVHISDSGRAAKVAGADVNGTGASFEAGSFSVFTLLGIDSEEEVVGTDEKGYCKKVYTINLGETVVCSPSEPSMKNGQYTGTWCLDNHCGDYVEMDKSQFASTGKVLLTGKKLTGDGVCKVAKVKYDPCPGCCDFIYIRVVEKKITVKFDPNGGDKKIDDYVMGKEEKGDIELPDYDGKNGNLKFVGWSLRKDAMTQNKYTESNAAIYDPGTTYSGIKADTTFYAMWATLNTEAEFYVRLDGVIPYEPQGHPQSEYAPDPPGIKISGALKEGRFRHDSEKGVDRYLAKKPSDDQLKTGLATKNIRYNPDTMYVKWYVIKRESTWHVDGVLLEKAKNEMVYSPNADGLTGTVENMPDGKSYPTGSVVTIGQHVDGKMRTPVLDGYKFQGWNTKADGKGTMHQNGTKFTIKENTTLYAIWKKNEPVTYVVKYVDDEGNVVKTSEERTAYDGDKVAVTVDDYNAFIEGEGDKVTPYEVDRDDNGNITEITIKEGEDNELVLHVDPTSLVGYNLMLGNAQWVGSAPSGYTKRNIGGKTNVYFWDKGVAKGKTFTVINNVPKCEGYVFLGWYDKTKKIVKAGESLTQNCDPGSSYILDALWAKVEARDRTVTYDGNQYGIDFSVVTNQSSLDGSGTLDEKSQKEVAGLISQGNPKYSVIKITKDDSGNIVRTPVLTNVDYNPTFSDAGVYEITRVVNAHLGGSDVTLTATGTLRINKASVTIASEGGQKKYDGTPLKVEKIASATSNNGLSAEKILELFAPTGFASITNPGEIDNKFTYTPNANYTVTPVYGKLKITKKNASDQDIQLQITPYTGVYDGKPHTITVTNKDEIEKLGGKIEYSTDGKNWSTTPPSFTHVTSDGGETVYVRVTGDNIDGTVTGEGKVTITRAKVVLQADNKSKFLKEADPALTASIAGTPDNSTDIINLAGRTFTKEKLAEIAKKLVRAKGEKVIKNGYQIAFVNPDTTIGNFDVEYKPGVFMIYAKDGDQNSIKGNDISKVYDGDPITFVAEPGKEGSVVEYSLDGQNWQQEPFSFTNVKDSGDVHVRVTNDYYEPVEAVYHVTITPARVVVEADNKTKEYKEADPEFTVKIHDGSPEKKDIKGFDPDKFSFAPPTRAEGEMPKDYDIIFPGTYEFTAPMDKDNFSVVFVPGKLYINDKDLYFRYDLNYENPEGSIDPETCKVGESITVTDKEPTRKDYTFLGWYSMRDGSGKKYEKGDSVLMKDDRTVYAQWDYQLTDATFYVLDGGETPDENGAASGKFSNGMNIGDVVLKKEYTDLESRDGITVGQQADGQEYLRAVPSENQIIADCKASGIDFDPATQYVRWYAIRKGGFLGGLFGEEWRVDGQIVKKSAIIYKNANESIKLEMPKSTYVKKGDSVTVVAPEHTVYYDEASKTTYTFIGWKTQPNGAGDPYEVGTSYPLQNSVTVYAQWHKSTALTLSYDLNGYFGATRAVAPAMQEYNSINDAGVDADVAGAPQAVTGGDVPGFMGWNTQADGKGEAVAPGSKKHIDGSTILYAQWDLSKVNKVQLGVKGLDAEYFYDGVEHSITGFEGTVSAGETADESKAVETVVEAIGSDGETYYVSNINITKHGKNCGDEYKVVDLDIDNAKITNAQGKDVTKYVSLTADPGKFIINPRKVTLSSDSDTKPYDGKELTNKNVNITSYDSEGGVGFVPGEGIVIHVTGRQTLVGSSKNTYTYEAQEGTLLTNYDIRTETGTLKVTDVLDDGDTPVPGVAEKTHKSGIYALGQQVVFALKATNIYARPMNITFKEQAGVTVAQPVFENVAPGAVVETTATYTITEKDIVRGSYTNKVNVVISDPSNPDSSKTYTDTDTVTTEQEKPSVAVEKKADKSGPVFVGEKITYTITVMNNGNVTATDVVVKDDLTGDGWKIESLPVGAAKSFSTSYTVVEKDVAAGVVKNVAAVTGKVPTPGTDDGDNGGNDGSKDNDDNGGNKDNDGGNGGDKDNDSGNGGNDDKGKTDVTGKDEEDVPVNTTYKLTIHYQDTAGAKLAEDYNGFFKYGEKFKIDSPMVSGYTPEFTYVSSGDSGMPAQDIEVTVAYTRNPSEPNEPNGGKDIDDGGDNNGGGNNDGGNDDKNNDGGDNGDKNNGSGDNGDKNNGGGNSGGNNGGKDTGKDKNSGGGLDGRTPKDNGGKNNGGKNSGGSNNGGGTSNNGGSSSNNGGSTGGNGGGGTTTVVYIPRPASGGTAVDTNPAGGNNNTPERVKPQPSGAVVTVADDGMPELVTAQDTETPLADLELDHLCNILYFLILMALCIEAVFYVNNMKGHQEKVHDLKERIRNKLVR